MTSFSEILLTELQVELGNTFPAPFQLKHQGSTGLVFWDKEKECRLVMRGLNTSPHFVLELWESGVRTYRDPRHCTGKFIGFWNDRFAIDAAIGPDSATHLQ